MSENIVVKPATGKLISFAEALARRAQLAAPAAAPPVDPDELQPTTHMLGMPLFTGPGGFALLDVFVDEATGQVCFESKAIHEHMRAAFACWGFELADFTRSFDDMLAAYQVFVMDFSGHIRDAPSELSGFRDAAKSFVSQSELERVASYGSAMESYLSAVKAGDVNKAKALMPESGILEHMRLAREHEHAKSAAAEAPRLPRSDARVNPVLGPLLSTPIKGAGKGETYADFLSEFLPLAVWHKHMMATRLGAAKPEKLSDAEQAKNDRWFALCRSPAYGQLHEWGVIPVLGCPRPGEAAILFSRETFASTLDGSQLRGTWRTELGPFVGFDQDFRLILEKDLAWWRLDHAHSEQWAGSPTGAEQPPAAARPLRLGPPAKPAAPRPHLAVSFKKKVPVLALHLGGHVIQSTDAFNLGAAAALCGVSSVGTDFEVSPFEQLVIKSRKQWGVGSDLLSALGTNSRPEYRALELFHQGLLGATCPDKVHPGGGWAAWFNETRLPEVLKLVPKELLKRDKL